MKPTKFLTSSIFMAKKLQARCDHSHVHQQLKGGRCKDAAYYPLLLIREMLRGIHDSVAGMKLAEENAELITTLKALGNHPVKLPEVVERQDVVKKSKIKRSNSDYVSINYDCWRPKDVDE